MILFYIEHDISGKCGSLRVSIPANPESDMCESAMKVAGIQIIVT